MEKLTLPDPAASLWKRIRDTVHELGTRRPEQQIRPHLGGGTTLAARWGHRRSTDIDVTLPGDPSLGDLARKDEQNLAMRIGGKASREDEDEIKVICPDGALHVARLKPHAPGAESIALVDGQEEIVLSNAQILRGKLSRAADSPVRDVFDIICAAKADPQALATAVGTVNTQQAERIATRWRTANDEFAREAATELRDVNPEFETPRNTLGSDAARALANHRYVRLEIEVEKDVVVIRKTIGAGALPDERYPLKEARTALAASGVDEHLDTNGPTMPIKMAIAIETMTKYKRTGTLYDSNNPATKNQVAFPNKHFEPGWKPFATELGTRKPTTASGDPTIGVPKRPGGTTASTGKPARVPSRPGSEPGTWKTKLKEELRIEDEPDDPPEPPSPATGTAEAAKQREQRRNKPQR